ncbi:MAG: hypothetical protein JJU02_08420 [Cryomorphaceae bacterium]|nr:hypothetical protein [Cryomorphaceae bacterium]
MEMITTNKRNDKNSVLSVLIGSFLSVISILGAAYFTNILVRMVADSATVIGTPGFYRIIFGYLVIFDLIFFISLLFQSKGFRTWIVLFVIANLSVVTFHYFKWPLHADILTFAQKFDGFLPASPKLYLLALGNIIFVYVASIFIIKKL